MSMQSKSIGSDNDGDTDVSSQIVFTSSEQLVDALQRLLDSVTSWECSSSSTSLSHWRVVPPVVTQAYDILTQGAALIHATSTKYTLMGKIEKEHPYQQLVIAQDLWQGCQLVATAVLVLLDPTNGTAYALRHAVHQAARGILTTVQQLVQVFANHEALDSEHHEHLGAQKTGAVWSTCNVILEKQLPKGNRNAMRRDLLIYIQECQETMHEFQAMLDLGARVEKDADDDDDHENEDTFDDDEDQYTSEELPLATACVALIKCSRGCLNATLQACESVGSHLDRPLASNDQNDTMRSTRLQWLAQVHDTARVIGDGMTDLGATLYPPLDYSAVQEQVQRQTQAMRIVLSYLLFKVSEADTIEHAADVHDSSTRLATTIFSEEQQSFIDVGADLKEMATKLQKAVTVRHFEATEALQKHL
jgi:hypothetical protein